MMTSMSAFEFSVTQSCPPTGTRNSLTSDHFGHFEFDLSGNQKKTGQGPGLCVQSSSFCPLHVFFSKAHALILPGLLKSPAY
jgi:hypothetical protein